MEQKKRIAELERRQEELTEEIDNFEIDQDDYEEQFCELLDVGGPVQIAGIQFYPSAILGKLDPIAYKMALLDYIDEDEDERYSELMRELEELQETLNEERDELEELEELEEQPKTEYMEIVFLQGDEAIEPLQILDEQGEAAAMKYMKQWDNGDDSLCRDEPGAGKSDTVYQEGDYLMNYNPRIGYIGLEKIL